MSERIFPNDRWITENEIRTEYGKPDTKKRFKLLGGTELLPRCRRDEGTVRIVVEACSGRVEATLWVDGCPVEGHDDSTGTLSTHSLVAPLLRKFDEARGVA